MSKYFHVCRWVLYCCLSSEEGAGLVSRHHHGCFTIGLFGLYSSAGVEYVILGTYLAVVPGRVLSKAVLWGCWKRAERDCGLAGTGVRVGGSNDRVVLHPTGHPAPIQQYRQREEIQ